MQLTDLVKPLDQLTDEELRERLQMIRNNRTVVRPAAVARQKRSENKGRQTKVTKAKSLLDGLSPEQLKQILLELGE